MSFSLSDVKGKHARVKIDVTSQLIRCLLYNFAEETRCLRPYTETIANEE